MIEIKVGVLLDDCEISYTRKQLSKLEDLINNFVQTQISKYLKEIDTDPIAINKDALDDKLETKNEIKTEETDFSEDNAHIKPLSCNLCDYKCGHFFVSGDLISDYIPEDSDTEIKFEVEDNQLVCAVCKLSCESKILLDLHFKMTHYCELSFDQRYNFKWTCPCCSEKFYLDSIHGHFKDCEAIFH